MTGTAQEVLAFDRASVRSMDADGHLHVTRTNISKATVNPYLGSEIPDFQALGLNPDKVYRLLRHPDELQKAAGSFNNKPLLLSHKPVSASDHAHDLTVGAVNDVVWEPPYLKAALVVWPGDAIRAIESDRQKQLSCGYRYRADMTPGTYEGEAFDGVMRDIVGNHVALVKEGRAGPDVVVGDSKENLIMNVKTVLSRKAAVAQGALVAFLRPKLAQDAKVDLTPMLAGVTQKNFRDRKPKIIQSLKDATKGKLAKDATIDDVIELLDQLEEIEPAEVVEAAVNDPNGLGPEATDASNSDARAFLASKGLSPEDISKVIAMLDGPDGAAAEAMDAAKRAQADADRLKAEKDKMITKPAMDAAIAAAVKAAEERAAKTQRDIRDAEREVRPRVGELAIAHDSAEAVFKTALTAMGVDIADVEPSAYRSLFKAIPAAPTQPRKSAHLAQDAASVSSFNTRFPDAAKIGIA
jgi:hypothetical protein